MWLLLALSLTFVTGCSEDDDPEPIPVEYGGITFPQGEISFADAVVSYTPGPGVSSPYDDPTLALEAPDDTEYTDNAVALGDEGVLVLRFTDNSLITSGDSEYDLWIFEIGDLEPTDVAISTDGTGWIEVGANSGATSGIDIDAYIGSGVVAGKKYYFVKLTDLLPHQTGSPYAGADIDAVGAITTVPEGIITAGGSDGVTTPAIK
ncbi:MAG: hypothetical protein B6244_11180 [Candidatus Cloacimonetes bacterium 4572_55]|nr:MAG: hypothetical protein B6244_11180 [Candidatus Cloacimonetes bacterium 4572_55]